MNGGAPGRALRFVKGHGTRNDFVVLPDPDDRIDLSAPLVRAICDRRGGVGADGVLRVVRTAMVEEVAGSAPAAPWFMDYRNADGSVAEMCGNGVRVFARYLVETGLVAAGSFGVATRDGVKRVTVTGPASPVVVAMGRARLLPTGDVHVTAGPHRYLATAVSVGNPHLVVPVADLGEPGDLREPPAVDPPDVFPGGVNVEFVLGRGPGRIAVRVFERGAGETRSCGTGACAAAVAAAIWWNSGHPVRSTVEVAGGVLTVDETPDGELELAGDATLVADGELRAAWLAAAVPVLETAADG